MQEKLENVVLRKMDNCTYIVRAGGMSNILEETSLIWLPPPDWNRVNYYLPKYCKDQSQEFIRTSPSAIICTYYGRNQDKPYLNFQTR